uniref:Putative secreted protein n=1 Tax=Anopheles darlingi TaxID=43151 RepID=A0A2M4DBI3_ANODA
MFLINFLTLLLGLFTAFFLTQTLTIDLRLSFFLLLHVFPFRYIFYSPKSTLTSWRSLLITIVCFHKLINVWLC